MEKQTSLSALRDLVNHNQSYDWNHATAHIRVYSRQACTSDEDPRPRYNDVGMFNVSVRDIVETGQCSEDWLMRHVGCSYTQDVVIGNIITFKGAEDLKLWYPQMDFMVKQLTSDSWSDMMGKVEPAYAPMALNFYDSGRSYHGHGFYLMDRLEWTCWLGVMLRLNNEAMKQEPVVDARWIGKALYEGESFLRVTANSSHYVKVPLSINLDQHRDGEVCIATTAF